MMQVDVDVVIDDPAGAAIDLTSVGIAGPDGTDIRFRPPERGIALEPLHAAVTFDRTAARNQGDLVRMASTLSKPETASRRSSQTARRIAALDPEEDYEEIARFLYAREFSWDIQRALEFALFRTYAVPAISGLLAKTGEFASRPRKRYDDTELLLAETIEHGLDSPRGQRSIARMNAMHGRFRIDNADMLYVLSTFVCEPIRWLDRFGRRSMTETEQRAWFLYYRGLGERMGIRDIPLELAGLMRWNREYEAANFRFSDTNRRIAEATGDLLLSFYLPRWLFWAGRPAVGAFLDRPLLESMGFRPAPGWLRRLVAAALRARAGVLRRLPPRRRPRHLTQVSRPTYPEGYRIEELGTFPRAKLPSRKPSG